MRTKVLSTPDRRLPVPLEGLCWNECMHAAVQLPFQVKGNEVRLHLDVKIFLYSTKGIGWLIN